MQTDIVLTKRFCDLTDEGSQILATLCRLSDEEKQAIEQLDPEALQQCISQKQLHLELLADNTLKRNETLVELGFSADQQGVEELKHSLPEAISRQIAKHWQQLVEQLKQAQKLNERNEQIVQRNQQNLGNLLRILQGQDSKQTLYNDSGSKGNYSAQNTLGKA